MPEPRELTPQSQKVVRVFEEARPECDYLTPAQQALLDYLNKLATSPYSVELIEEGNQVLDAAVAEHQALTDSIHQTERAISTVKKCASREALNG